jgi:hypothetical protein
VAAQVVASRAVLSSTELVITALVWVCIFCIVLISRHGSVVRFCEDGNELPGYIKMLGNPSAAE